MNIDFFTPATLPQSPRRAKQTGSLISISSTGKITLSEEVVRLLEVAPGSGILVGQDRSRPKDFYLVASDEGYRLREQKDKSGVLYFSHARLSSMLLETLQLEAPVRFTVAHQPEELEGIKAFAILTSKPLQKKRTQHQ